MNPTDVKAYSFCHLEPNRILAKDELGYNMGINHGQARGQTVPHLHIHLIPSYRGDKETRGAGRGG